MEVLAILRVKQKACRDEVYQREQTMPDMPISLFISYAHADSAFVDRLEADLQKQGFDPWVDRQRLVGGVRWRRELQEAVKRAQVLLIVLSPDAVASQNVQIEYDYVLDVGKVIIPLYYRQCEVPMELRDIQWIDFRQSYEQGLASLVQALHRQQNTAQAWHPQGPYPPTSPLRATTFQGAAPTSEQEVAISIQPEPQAERPWNVPFGRNPFFTGRGQLLEHLHTQLSRSHSAALTQSYALSGLGGIGKTQTAIEYAYRYRDEYSGVFWVRADSRETLVADFVTIARLLSLPGQDVQEQMQIVGATKRWLEQHEGWLLILDNADELSLLTDFLPTEGKGYLLLTTRAQATGKIAQSLSVEKMERSEGTQLLLRRAKLLDPQESYHKVSAAIRKVAQQLVTELDGLPLALDQAGAYIEETGCGLSEYLQLYAQRRLALLQQSSVSADYPHTVASTWALSFQQVEQANPAAADLLRMCAFLHPDAIPEAIISEGAAELGPQLAPVAVDPLLLNEAIQILRRYSLVKRDPDGRLLNIHRLVQVVLQESLDAETRRQWAERSVRAVNRAFPQVEFATWERCERCLPHTLLCAQWIRQYGFTFPEAARLLHAAGVYLRDRGRYTQAEPLLERALALRQQMLGPENQETASTLNELAWLYELHGKYTQAERLLQPALANFERVLGAEHPEVAEAIDTLANVYVYEGKYAEAEPLLQRALAIREQALGKSHPLVSDTLNNLALLYDYQGKYAQAEPLYQRSLAIDEDTRGSEHPETLITLHHLANLYANQGKYAQAEPLLQQVLALFERVVGAEHPRVAETLTSLAQLYTRQGHYQQAEPLLARALSIDEHALGPEHPQTAMALDAQGYLALLEGREEQAEPLLQRALAIQEQALGNAHPDVARTLHHLAELYEKQGKGEQAQSLYQQALSIREQTLGREHPDTVATREASTRLLRVLQAEEQQGLTSQPRSVRPA